MRAPCGGCQQPDAWIPDLDLEPSKVAFRVLDRETEDVLVLAGVDDRIEFSLGGGDPREMKRILGFVYRRLASGAQSIDPPGQSPIRYFLNTAIVFFYGGP